MFLIKYCGSWNYRPQAESLSAKINATLPDTCEIKEGSKGQFDLYLSGELFLSKAILQKFFTFEDVQLKLKEKGLGSHLENLR